MILFVRSALFNGLFYLLLLFFGVACTPLMLCSRKWTVQTIKLFIKINLWLLQRICGLSVEIRGNVPTGRVLVCAKHQSFLDVLILYRALPRPVFIMKRELRWLPIFGSYAVRAGALTVKREKGATALRRLLKEVRKSWHNGQLVIYPQGTRVATGVAAPYHRGAVILYRELKVDCVSVATNTGVFWSRNSFLRRPGLAIIQFLPVIESGQDDHHFMRKMQESIEQSSAALLES